MKARSQITTATCEQSIDSWMSHIDEVTKRGKVLKMVIMESDHQDDEFTEVASLLFNCKRERGLN